MHRGASPSLELIVQVFDFVRAVTICYPLLDAIISEIQHLLDSVFGAVQDIQITLGIRFKEEEKSHRGF